MHLKPNQFPPVAAVAIALVIAAAAAAAEPNARSTKNGSRSVVTIGSKRFTENVILGEMIAHLARAAGAKVVHCSDLGGTPIVFKSLQEGSIDIYAEYTG